MIARKQLMTRCLMINNSYLSIPRAQRALFQLTMGNCQRFNYPLSVAVHRRHARLTCECELTVQSGNYN